MDLLAGALGMLSADFAARPYWLDDAPLPESPPLTLPAAVDVLIVGAGYTGLAAARETALAGRSTLVLDAGPIGGGCSSRNGGQVGFSIKPGLATLGRRHGARVARGIHLEAQAALADLRALAREPGVDCDWRDNGCFYGAHTRRHFGALCREVEHQPAGLEQRYTIVPRALQAEEIGSDFYHGGVVYPDDAAVHPSRLVRALHARAIAAGAAVQGACAVEALARSTAGFLVRTAAGTLTARSVLLATNGYSGPLSPWHRRRIVPLGSYIIATEPLEPGLMRRLLPRARNVVDTRRVVVYFRPSPDGRRIVFGGRAAAGERDPTRCVPRLRAMLAEIYPELATVRVSHAWMGFVAFTFDTLPHLGVREGLYHCLGYCGQGVPLASYYGRKVGLQMAGRAGGESALTGLPFPTLPFYHGWPWFLPAAVLTFRMRDRLGL